MNLPRKHSTPAELRNCIAATKFKILGGPLNRVRDNLTQEERKALAELKLLQKECRIVIKRSDTAGGLVIMDYLSKIQGTYG